MQLAARGLEIAAYGVQRDFRPSRSLGGGLRGGECRLQRHNPVGRGVLLRVDCPHHTRDFGVQGALAVGVLAGETLRFRMSAAQARLLGLDLSGKLLLLRPQCCHRGCDRCLRLSAGSAAGGIETAVRRRTL